MKNRVFLLCLSVLAVLFIFIGILGAESSVTHNADSSATSVSTVQATPNSALALPAPTPVVSPAAAAADNPIQIVEPAENAHLPSLATTFICGSVPSGGKLWINGAPVPVHPGGGFLTMIHLTPGTFQIKADYQLGDTVSHLTRTILVAAPEQPVPTTPLTIVSVSPGQDQALLPGDSVIVSCKGSPGMKGYFTVAGVRKRFPMIAAEPSSSGIYQGVYLIGEHDRLHKSRIKVTLVDPRNKQKAVREAGGQLSLFAGKIPVIAETVSSDVILRAGPALGPDDKAGYLMFPPQGTLLRLSGRIGAEYRVRLTATQTVWVGVDQVKLLPAGTPPPTVVVGGIAVRPDGTSTLIRIPLERKIPFKIEPDSAGNFLDVSLYGAFSNTDLIANPSGGAIRNIRWFQDDTETYRIWIDTAPRSWWGYDARYEGNTLVLELRTPPPAATLDGITRGGTTKGGSSPLTGLTIAVDAGHGKGGGAMGVTGYPEGDANMAMALNLRDKLQALGAQVILTRPGDPDIPLNDRTRFAWQQKADLLISLHNNSLGYGGNPLLKHGFGVYYFTPQSQALAQAVHAAYQKAFPEDAPGDFHLPDDGLYYDNLALTRPTQMPAILIETAYMIVPAEEAYLKTEAFRAACSDAIIEGIESYIRGMRSEAAPPR